MIPSALHQFLSTDLAQRDQQAMRRRLLPVDQPGKFVTYADEHRAGALLNLAGNDYLGLANHPQLRDAAVKAVNALGSGAAASRLVVGTTVLHDRIEQQLADFKHAEAALLTPTGYMANLAVLTTLAGPGDLVCLDKLNHASLIDAARASGATLRTYPHLGYDKLRRLLSRFTDEHPTPHASDTSRPPTAFIVTDAVFSMDGDVTNLPTLCILAKEFNAVLVVDEAHGTGVLGDDGSGLAQAQGVAGQIDVTVSTASKALGHLGGVITANQLVIDTLVNNARSFIYTTGIPPAQAATIGAAIDVVRDEPQRRERLAALSQRAFETFRQQGWPLEDRAIHTPIFPLIVGEPQAAVEAQARLEKQGILAVAIRPPTVPPGSARLRLSLRADLTDDEMQKIFDATQSLRS